MLKKSHFFALGFLAVTLISSHFLFLPKSAEATYPNQATQSISLEGGWNLISFNVIPDDTSIESIFAPLVNEKLLEKVIDERGKTYVNLLGTWYNYIGDMNIEEGYMVKVSQATILEVTGVPVYGSKTWDIEMDQGWNIMGYPSNTEQSAYCVLKPIINDGSLDKVVDENSNDIFYKDTNNEWVNKIGNMEPGKGYYVRLNAAGTVKIDEHVGDSCLQTDISATDVGFVDPVYINEIYSGDLYVVVKNTGSESIDLRGITANVGAYDEGQPLFSGASYIGATLNPNAELRVEITPFYGPSVEGYNITQNLLTLKGIVDVSELLRESDENNNTFSKSINIDRNTERLPDLIVKDIYNENGIIKIKVCNQGTGSTGATNFYTYINGNGKSIYGDNYPLNNLTPGDCAIAGEYPLSTFGLSGTSYVFLASRTDWKEVIAETDDDNNRTEKSVYFSTEGIPEGEPDLPTCSSQRIEIVHENALGRYEFQSLGLDTSAHPEIMRYRIRWSGGNWSPWYTPGYNDIDWKNSFRRIWSYFDDHEHEYEKCVILPDPKPDLKIESTLVQPNTVDPTTKDYAVYFKNVWLASSFKPFKIKLYDKITGYTDYKEVNSYAQQNVDFWLNEGVYDLILTIDSENTVDESNEDNNTFTEEVTIIIDSKPDLTVKSIFYEDNRVKIEYCNEGGEPARNSFGVAETFYIRVNGHGKTHTGTSNNSNYVFSVPGAGECKITDGYPLSYFNNLSGNGIALFSAIVDSTNNILESNENNNLLLMDVHYNTTDEPDIVPIVPMCQNDRIEPIRRKALGGHEFQSLGLDTSAHPEIMRYRIRWSGGGWSSWYTPGYNDVDWKNSFRRIWSYFDDHEHEYEKCVTSASNLTLSRNQSFGDQNVVAPMTQAKVASFVLQSGNSEGVCINTINISRATSGTMQNMKLKSGDVQIGSTKSTLSSDSSAENVFSISNLALSKNEAKVIDVYADIKQNSNVKSINIVVDAAGTLGLTGQAVTASDQVMQVINIISGSITARAGADQPLSQFVLAGTTVKMNSVQFLSSGEAFTVDKVRIAESQLNSRDSIGKIILEYTDKNNSTQTKEAYLDNNGIANFSGLSLYVPQNGSALMTIRATIPTLSAGADSGDNPALDFIGNENFSALGESSNLVIANQVDSIVGNEMLIRKSIPTIITSGLPNNVLNNGLVTLYKFNVLADVAGDVAWQKTSFQINTDGDVVFADYTLYDSTGLALGTATTIPHGEHSNIIQVELPTAEIITAGSQKSYILKAVATSSANSLAEVKLLGDDNKIVMPDSVNDLTANSHFIWSDMSNISATSSLTDNIWSNGFSLKTFGQSVFLAGTDYSAPSEDPNEEPSTAKDKESLRKQTPASRGTITSVANRLRGRLLLAVENKGRVYYVHPETAEKHEVTFGNLMLLFQTMALGISNHDLNTIPINPESMSEDEDSDGDGYSDKSEARYGYNPFVSGGDGSDKVNYRALTYNRLKGRILLQAEDKGQIWYVDEEGKRWQVTWDNAMNIFRHLSLGINNQDLEEIESGDE